MERERYDITFVRCIDIPSARRRSTSVTSITAVTASSITISGISLSCTFYMKIKIIESTPHEFVAKVSHLLGVIEFLQLPRGYLCTIVNAYRSLLSLTRVSARVPARLVKSLLQAGTNGWPCSDLKPPPPGVYFSRPCGGGG